jgi:hypothetical protein
MSKLKPNIITPFNDKLRVKNLILEVIDDSWIFQHTPDSISLNGELFTLTLLDKKLVFQDVQVDSYSDYIDIYLYGLKITESSYGVVDNGSDIIITFTDGITLNPETVTADGFLVKGKIVSR